MNTRVVKSRVFGLSSPKRRYDQFDKLSVKRYKKRNRIPGSIVSIGWGKLKEELLLEMSPMSSYRRELNDILSNFTLDDAMIMHRERTREAIQCPRLMRVGYDVTCYLLDVVYRDKPIDRFWFLENVARMPYFSYVALLHLYETLGWWYVDSDVKRQHVEQEANETHHLSIMESLYGDRFWWNRALTRHVAIAYYMILLFLFAVSPKVAYISSELLEMHAYDTYSEFAEQNKYKLQTMRPTYSAIQYMPRARNMYEVFVQIADDEKKHAVDMRTMKSMDYI